jgi:drug/metabolite transporter (DMT)-like permease
MLLMFEAILTSALGIALFREPLTLHFVLGSTMILGSGIYLGWRQDKNVVGIDGDSLSVSE